MNSAAELMTRFEELEKGWYVADPDTGALPYAIISAGADRWIKDAISAMKDVRTFLARDDDTNPNSPVFSGVNLETVITEAVRSGNDVQPYEIALKVKEAFWNGVPHDDVVVQIDRDAASALTDLIRGQQINSKYVADGQFDDHRLVQAFKNHRLAATRSSENTWTEWSGGDQPLPVGTKVAFQQRDAAFDTGEVGALDWSHNGPDVEDGDSDIMRFRIIYAPEADQAGPANSKDTGIEKAVALCKRMELDAANLTKNDDERKGISGAAWNLGIAINALAEHRQPVGTAIAGEHTIMLETARYILSSIAHDHRESDPAYASACTKAAQGCRAAAIALETDTEDTRGDDYPLKARIWKRSPYGGCPDGEWVLEIVGSINDTYFVCRHTEPLTVAPENVAGLPSLFEAVYLAEPARRIVEKIADAVGTMQREGSDGFDAGCTAIQRECLPLFEDLGMVDTGEGLGFDEDYYPGVAPRHEG